MATRREFVTTAAAVLARPGLMSAADPKPIAEVPAEKPIRVGVLVFPKMDQIDLTGPFAVLSRLPNATVKLLGRRPTRSATTAGWASSPTRSWPTPGRSTCSSCPAGPGRKT
jgi:cyclohexyl-isocyanide hydratase